MGNSIQAANMIEQMPLLLLVVIPGGELLLVIELDALTIRWQIDAKTTI